METASRQPGRGADAGVAGEAGHTGEERSSSAEMKSEAAAARLRRAAASELRAGRRHEALFLFEKAAPLCEAVEGAGDFAAEFADLLALIGEAERRGDYLERALAQYEAAARRFEKDGDAARCAAVLHAAARLCLTLGRHREAHERLYRARALVGDADVHLAHHLGETRARILLAEGRPEEAEASARDVVRALEAGGASSLLAWSLATHGAALARLGRVEEAHASLRQARDAARRAGDAEAEGHAALTLVEELEGRVPFEDLAEAFERATSLLAPARSLPLSERLCAAARRVISLAGGREPVHSWKGFSLREAVHRFEAGVIARALADAGGSVSRAARLLGFRHHNSLASILNHRHQELLAERSPVKPRRRSIITVRGGARSPRFAGVGRASIVLHVEDDPAAAEAVRVALEADGCRVETCPDGHEALSRLHGPAPYDLILLKRELTGAPGVEIVRAARSLPHRRATPVVLLSAGGDESDALEAGADLLLREPPGAPALAAAVRRLLPKKGSRQ